MPDSPPDVTRLRELAQLLRMPIAEAGGRWPDRPLRESRPSARDVEIADLLDASARAIEQTTKDGRCTHCGAPVLKPGQSHAIVNPPRPAPTFYVEDDEPAPPRDARQEDR